MKKFNIRKVAVLGSGIMGSRIACHFANIGIEVLLLDIAPKELNGHEQKKGMSLEHPAVRNRIVNESFQKAVKSKPAPLYHPSYAQRVKLGNFKDNMKEIADYDWIIEVVVEKLNIKNVVFEQVEQYRKPGTLITSNTSGIPINMMLDGRSEDFQKHFCGTHFFNPPRYLRLLEIIPSQKTDPEIVEFLMHYGDLYLGKETVLCKDTPAFIANRVGVYGIISAMHTIEEMGLTVGEVDKLTGPLIGRAKSATFRTMDVVGLDTTVNVSNNLYQALQHDESRGTFKLPGIVKELYDRNWLGDKTGQGYYKKIKDEKGKSVILELDFKTYEYGERTKAQFPSLEMAKPKDDLQDRLNILVNAQDKAGEFYRAHFFDLFRYCTFRIPEIADELFRIDQAVSAGFGWEAGPFETWDMLGVQKTVEQMEEAGQKPAQWVYEMLKSGAESFYKAEDGKRMYYDIDSKSYKVVPGTDDFILLDTLRENKILWTSDGATILDLGDGVLNVEFHTKMNTLGNDPVEAINRAIDMAEKDYRGVLIGNEGQNFSAGANLAMLFMFAIEQEFDEIEMMIRQFQNTMMRARYSSVPVVVAPHGLALGGGCELTMHADQVVANAETYIGLVEVGVGLIPAGGGTKEMALRVSDSHEAGDVEFNALQNALMNIATAKVATSAQEAFDMHILCDRDKVNMNISRQIAEAREALLAMAEYGYSQPVQRTDIKVQGKPGIALFLAGIYGMHQGHYISDHDRKIVEKVAYVICGGELSHPQHVSEQYLLDLEREAFLSLTGEKKTLERIQSLLQGGKPVRN
jgi:3-hydroxyacyl-CoA dehydrogenase